MWAFAPWRGSDRSRYRDRDVQIASARRTVRRSKLQRSSQRPGALWRTIDYLVILAAILVVHVTSLPVSDAVAGAKEELASVRIVHGSFRFQGTAGKDRVLFATGSRDGKPAPVFLISTEPLRVGPGCRRVPNGSGHGRFAPYPFWVRCSQVRSTRWVLGAGADQVLMSKFFPGPFTWGWVPSVVRAGAGDDDVSGGFARDVLAGGSGDDEVIAGTGQDRLFGGDGNDRFIVSNRFNPPVGAPGETFHGGSGNDLIRGGDGADVLLGGAGNDDMGGGFGDDRLVGGPGGDEMSGGGGGGDVLDYSSRTSAVSVTDDGVANDGVPGEGDNVLPASGGTVHGTEIVQSGSGDDTIAMTGARVRLFGNDGNDQITIDGGPGAAFGGLGADALVISGAPGRLRGGAGDDSLTSADASVDHDGCGPGDDDVTADASDVVSGTCENTTIS
jgi:hypothetical protein